MQRNMTQPEIEMVEHPNYRTINVSGILGSYRAMFFEVVLHSDELKATKALAAAQIAPERSVVKRTLECRLLIDPFQAKLISQWLIQQVNEYERIFGRIPSPEEVAAKQDKSGLE